ncbi:MAG: toxin-antitoxin system YwqK family antitoxin, partial [Bacteroidales bacterium]|nr:toxin-antitoxin system YwqK family antitoxin [Bacteroidales bacterium]
MYKITVLLISLFLSSLMFAQTKDEKKLKTLYDKKDYDKCIEQSLKILKKNPKSVYANLFVAKSYFEQFKKADEKIKSKTLRNSLKYAGKAKKYDKQGMINADFETFYAALKDSTKSYANRLYYGENKEKSKFAYDYLAKIYGDTTVQFIEFHPEYQDNPESKLGLNTQQKKVNQVDEQGRKQGFWTKKYRNGVTAYEVTFKDDKPIGEYKRYHENGKLYAFLIYDDKGDWADAKLYDEDGELIGEGKYYGKLKDGLWKYYDKGAKVAEENFTMGKKNGQSKTYFRNGQMSEEKNWKDNVENGVWRQYYENGKKRLETKIDMGVRNSVYYVYYQNGRLKIRGQYKNDLMDGKWIYYDTDGKVLKEIVYHNGKAENEDELEKEEQEIFKQFEINKKRQMDPKDYINKQNNY